MAAIRGAVPLLLTGTAGLTLLGFGLTGLSGVDPQLRSAAAVVQQERQTELDRRTAPTMEDVHCLPTHVRHATPEV